MYLDGVLVILVFTIVILASIVYYQHLEMRDVLEDLKEFLNEEYR